MKETPLYIIPSSSSCLIPLALPFFSSPLSCLFFSPCVKKHSSFHSPLIDCMENINKNAAITGISAEWCPNPK